MRVGVPDSTNKIVGDSISYYFDASQLRSYSGSGTTWTNLYGTGKNGTLTNGPTFTSAAGGGIVFDGTNDYVALGDPSSLNLYSASAMTFSSWCYLDYFLGGRMLLMTATAILGSARGPRIYFGAGGSPYVCTAYYSFQDVLGSNPAVYTTTNIPIATNFNITCTYDKVNMKIYYNGVFDSQTAWTRDMNKAAGTVHHIAAPDADSNYWGGRIYQAIMYTRALTAAEVLNNYNVTKQRFGL